MKATKENYELRRQVSLMQHYLNTGCVVEMRRKASSVKTNDHPYPAAQYVWAICTGYHVKVNNRVFEYRARGDAFFPIIGEEYEFEMNGWRKGTFIGYDDRGQYLYEDSEHLHVEGTEDIREIKEEPETQEEACAGCGLPHPSSNPYCSCKDTKTTWNFDNFSKNLTLEG